MRPVTLGELILTVKDKSGDSYRRMAERAAAHGYTLTFSRIQQLAEKPPTAVPKRDTLMGLAVALGVPVEDVAMAATESLLGEMGVDLSADLINNSRARAFVTITEGLDDATVGHVLSVTRKLVETFESAGLGHAAGTGGAPRDEPSTPGAGGDDPE